MLSLDVIYELLVKVAYILAETVKASEFWDSEQLIGSEDDIGH